VLAHDATGDLQEIDRRLTGGDGQLPVEEEEARAFASADRTLNS